VVDPASLVGVKLTSSGASWQWWIWLVGAKLALPVVMDPVFLEGLTPASQEAVDTDSLEAPW